MQHAQEDLEQTVMSATGFKIITTLAEDEADRKRSLARAQAHTKPQLYALAAELKKQRETRVNKDVKGGFTAALSPLEARLDGYEAEKQTELDRLARIKVHVYFRGCIPRHESQC